MQTGGNRSKIYEEMYGNAYQQPGQATRQTGRSPNSSWLGSAYGNSGSMASGANGASAFGTNGNAASGGAQSWKPPVSGSVGIRSALNNMGYSNNRIGWDGEYVTLDGDRLYRPDYLEDGTSYAESQSALSQAVRDRYLNQGKNVVKVTDYLANSQLPFDVSYNNGVLSIGGITTKPLYVDNNYAYMDAGELDRIIQQAQQASGLQSRQGIFQKYEDKYSPYYDRLVDAIVNREAFSYDPETDPAYQAYRLQYNREGDRAARDAAGAMAGMTGGYANSAAAIAAAQQQNYYAQQLTDQIPTLLQQAYGRYVDDYNMTRSALADVMGLDAQQFGREYGVNSDVMNDIRENNQLKTERERYAQELALQNADKEYERRLDAQLDPLTVASAQAQVEGQNLSNASANENVYGQRQGNLATERANALQAALYYGGIPAGQEAYYRALGFDPDNFDLDAEIRQAARAQEMQNDADFDLYKRKADYEIALQQMYGVGGASSGGSSGGSRSSGSGSSSSKSSGSSSSGLSKNYDKVTSNYSSLAQQEVANINDAWRRKYGSATATTGALIVSSGNDKYTINQNATRVFDGNGDDGNGYTEVDPRLFIIASIRDNKDMTDAEKTKLAESLNISLD